MLSVPAAAVLPAQQGMIAWVIGPDNKVAPRIVTVERIVGQTAYLRDGVKAGERVVTDGQIRLAPGMHGQRRGAAHRAAAPRRRARSGA